MLMESRIASVSALIGKASAEREILRERLAKQEEREESLRKRSSDALLAKELVLSVAQKTQVNIGKRISDLVSMALAAVFDDPYTFEVEFVSRRGTTEVDLWLVRDGNKIDPMTASGGGVLDIAGFALRLALWTLKKSSSVFILDEPFRNLSSDKHAKASAMLKKLSEMLGVQIIMVSHNPDIISDADKVFRLADGKISVE